MPWWGTLLIGIACGLLAALVLWLVLRKRAKPVDPAAVRQAAATEHEKALKAMVEFERLARAKVAKEAKHLADQLKSITTWYNDRKNKISKEAQDEFNRLVGDPEALDRKLDQLLATGAGAGHLPDDPEGTT
jgi:hypothetical protein